MIIYKNLSMAKEFGLPRQYAINCRRRFLNNELGEAEKEMFFYAERTLDAQSGFALYFWLVEWIKAAEYIATIHREVAISRTLDDRRTINEEDIERARNASITGVVDFRNRKAIAFCHDDHNPSLHHDQKHNRAHCFPCGKSFNAIDVLIMRDGYSFVEAVRRLAG